VCLFHGWTNGASSSNGKGSITSSCFCRLGYAHLMEVRLPPNKHVRAVRTISELASRKSVPQASFEETLGFLSHCCQVIPLGRPFLRQLFSLLKRKSPYSSKLGGQTGLEMVDVISVLLANYFTYSTLSHRPHLHSPIDPCFQSYRLKFSPSLSFRPVITGISAPPPAVSTITSLTFAASSHFGVTLIVFNAGTSRGT
jgi:hypothetical protein